MLMTYFSVLITIQSMVKSRRHFLSIRNVEQVEFIHLQNILMQHFGEIIQLAVVYGFFLRPSVRIWSGQIL